MPAFQQNTDALDAVAARLRDASYSTVLVNVPSLKSRVDVIEDVDAIKHIILEFATESRDVVLVMLDGGGATASRAARGLTKRERSADGELGGIVKLIYITSCLPQEGHTALLEWKERWKAADADLVVELKSDRRNRVERLSNPEEVCQRIREGAGESLGRETEDEIMEDVLVGTNGTGANSTVQNGTGVEDVGMQDTGTKDIGMSATGANGTSTNGNL